MVDSGTRARRRLTADDWIEEALAAVGGGGLAAVAVEPLAARLATTKGSFYWHFANREALLEAALARWEERTTTSVLRDIAATGAGPRDQLRALIVRTVDEAERDLVGPALLATADHPAVAPVLRRVTATRIEAIVGLFERLGFPVPAARSRALLAYSAYLGHAQLAHSTPDVLPVDKGARRAYLDMVLGLLTRPA